MNKDSSEETYGCVYFVLNGPFGALNALAAADKPDLAVDLVRSRRLRHVDFATGRVLHLANSLTALADNHADGIGRNVNRIIDLVVSAWAAGPAAAGVAVIARRSTRRSAAHGIVPSVSAITINNIEDELLGKLSSGRGANEVHRTETVYALALADNIDVASAAFLKVPDRLAAASDDKAHGSVGNHDLQAILSLLWQGRSIPIRTRFAGITSGAALSRRRTHTAIANDAVNHVLRFLTLSTGAGDTTLAHTVILTRGRYELHTAAALTLDAS